MNWTRCRSARALCAVLLLVAIGLAPQSAAAQAAAPEPEPGSPEAELRVQAKQRFQQAVSDYDAGRYEQALTNFQEAFRIRPHPLVNVNIANCYDKLGKPLQAIFHFQLFLESNVGAPAQRQEVNAAIERLRKQVGQLLLRVTPDGTTVVIDRGEQRRAPLLEPVQLEAGKHTLELRLEGYRTQRRTVIVRGGTTLELNLALARESEQPAIFSVTPAADAAGSAAPADAAGPAGAADSADAVDPQHTPAAEFEIDRGKPSGEVPAGVWIAGGITGALAVTALITGVLALSADADFDTARDRLALASAPDARLMFYEEARDHAGRAQALALATDILLIGVGIGAAVTAYVALTHEGEAATTARVTPALGPNAAGLAMHASF